MYSQCPECQVVFSVSDAQVGAHGGLVRCGYCQAVFDAPGHAVSEPGAETRATDSSFAEPNASQPGDDAAHAPDPGYPPDTIAPEPGVSEPELPEPEEREFDVSESEAPYTSEPVAPEPVAPEPEAPEPEAPEPEAPEPEAPESEAPELETSETQTLDTEAPEVLEPDLSRTGDESGRAPASAEEPVLSGGITEEITIEAPPWQTFDEDMSQDDTAGTTATAQAVPPSGGRAAAARGGDRQRTRTPRLRRGRDIRMVELPRPRSFGTLVLALLTVALAGLLLWQVKTSYLTELAQFPLLRPYLSLLCQPLSCTLPPRQDIGEVDLVDTSIDVNPTIPGALEIRVSLTNRAGFPQPYPPLRVTLTDREGRIVGRRTYLPAEYSPAGGADEKAGDGDDGPGLLPAGGVRDVSINLARPAQDAVGYEVELMAPVGG